MLLQKTKFSLLQSQDIYERGIFFSSKTWMQSIPGIDIEMHDLFHPIQNIVLPLISAS